MKINKLLTKKNFSSRRTRKIKYIVIHYTANNGDTAKNNCVYFQNEYRGASAHYFVDEREVWQCVENNNIAWHVGSLIYYNDCRNTNSIGVELCSRRYADGTYYFKKDTIKNAQMLVRMLLAYYKLDPKTAVIRHYDVSHKKCPEPFVRDELAWQNFKKGLVEDMEVFDEMEDYLKKYNTIDEVPDWAKASVQKAIDAGVLKGTNGSLNLIMTEIKTICWLDRCGNFD